MFNGLFIVADDDSVKLLRVDGNVITASGFDHFAKGMAFVPASSDPPAPSEITAISQTSEGVVITLSAITATLITAFPPFRAQKS